MKALHRLAERVLVDLAFVASIGVLASLGAAYWWPLELVGHLRGCFALGLVPIAVALFLLRSRFAAIATAAIAVVDLAAVVPLWFGPGAAEGPHDVRLLMANVHVQNERFERFLDLVDAERPDVITVFEYGRGWEEALQPLAADYPYHVSLARSDAFGIAFWSRIPCALELRGSEGTIPSIDAELSGPFGRLQLFAVHPARPGLTGPPTSRDAELRAAAERAAAATGPVVLYGDFNTTSHAPIFAEVLAVTGLRDARRGFGPRPTWPGRLARIGIAIDHVLVGDGVGVVDHRIGPAIGSDHRPLIVDLAVSGGHAR